MWDTAGCEKYRAMTLSHTRGAVGAIVVYDISDETTFYNCQYWVDDLRSCLDPHAMIALCANKVDIMFANPEKREVMKE
jgi:GTPase SAR1 family protein